MIEKLDRDLMILSVVSVFLSFFVSSWLELTVIGIWFAVLAIFFKI